jgi:hypothetical protein
MMSKLALVESWLCYDYSDDAIDDHPDHVIEKAFASSDFYEGLPEHTIRDHV